MFWTFLSTVHFIMLMFANSLKFIVLNGKIWNILSNLAFMMTQGSVSAGSFNMNINEQQWKGDGMGYFLVFFISSYVFNKQQKHSAKVLFEIIPGFKLVDSSIYLSKALQCSSIAI